MAEINAKFQSIFDSVDADRSGRISALELQKAMVGTGENVTFEACQILISLFDHGTGSIDIHGFAGLFELSELWKSVFKNFDKDNSGFIDAKELRTALRSIFKGLKFDTAYVKTLIAKFGSQKTPPQANDREGLNDEQFLLACAYVQKSAVVQKKKWQNILH